MLVEMGFWGLFFSIFFKEFDFISRGKGYEVEEGLAQAFRV